MKTYLSLKKPLQKLCESLLQYLLSLPPWLLQSDVKTQLLSHVRQVIHHGRVAVVSSLRNSRHLVGGIFLLLSIGSYFFHFTFSITPNDQTWYFTNWFFLFQTLRLPMIIIFGSLSALYFSPSTSKSVYIPFTVIQALGWCWFVHYAFFVDSYESFHAVPFWQVFVISGSIAVGFVICADHLVYVFEHKIKGNHKRFVGLAEMTGVDPELRDRMLKDNANEYRRLYTNY